MTGDSHNAKRKKENVRDIVDEDGNLIKEKIAGKKFENDEMLAKSRLEIYKSQLAPLHDNRIHLNRDENLYSNGELNKLVRRFYKDLYGLDLSKIYKKPPYTFKKKETNEPKESKKPKKLRNPPLIFPKYINVVGALLNYDNYKKMISIKC